MPLLLAILVAIVPPLVAQGLRAIGKDTTGQVANPVPDRISAIVKPAVHSALAAIEPHFPDWEKPAFDQIESQLDDLIAQECVKLNL